MLFRSIFYGLARKISTQFLRFYCTVLFLLVGTFGQPNIWDIALPSSYQHPMAPYDVLVDPLSVPNHPRLETTESETTNEKPYKEDHVRDIFTQFSR